jgi:hypothetical protein
MMPEPGFQNPTPYLAPAVAEKSGGHRINFDDHLRHLAYPGVPVLEDYRSSQSFVCGLEL